MQKADTNPVEPRPAAALIVVDDAEPARVLLARRNESLAFMGGQYCFPGGRINLDEGHAHVRPIGEQALAEALHAAVRETFEETGLLCVEGALPSAEVLRQARAATIASASAFDELLAAHDLWINADDFEPAGLWVTPLVSPIRFRTQYFLYRYSHAKVEEVLHGEIVDLVWLTAQEARRRWRAGDLDTSTPVGFVLGQLCRHARDGWARALCAVPTTAAGLPGRFEIRSGIYLVPLRTETVPSATHTDCIVIGEEESVVVNPGAPDPSQVEMLLNQIRHVGGGRGTVRAILLTHGHRNQVRGIEQLRDALGCPVWAHCDTCAQLGMRLDRELRAGDLIELTGDPPWRIRCMQPQDHDGVHLCFLEESSGLTISGDMVVTLAGVAGARKGALWMHSR